MSRPLFHFSAAAVLLLGLAAPMSSPSAQSTKTAEVNGVHLQYVEQGSGEPIVFVHGNVSDLRTWDMVRDDIAKRYRFIAYTQRYHGTDPWPDGGKLLSTATHAQDLATFIASLNSGPVHVVGWSFGGQVAATVAVNNPSLIRTLMLYEASVVTAVPVDSAEGKAVREDRGKMFGAAAAAAKGGEAVKAARLLVEAVFQLPPGGSYREPQPLQTMWDENARTTPLVFAAPPPPAVTCDMLKAFMQPTLVLEGEKTAMSYRLINDALSICVPKAQRVVLKNVNHDAPVRDPSGFSAAILAFVSNR
jgi:pimeloyl-ACP methyl ester carboxylesterase